MPAEWTRLKKFNTPKDTEKSYKFFADDDDEGQVGQGRLRGAESLMRRLLEQRTGVEGEGAMILLAFLLL